MNFKHVNLNRIKGIFHISLSFVSKQVKIPWKYDELYFIEYIYVYIENIM